jgi:hypothetical protein
MFGEFVDHIYPVDLEISSYFDLCLEIDSEDRLRKKHYDKRDDFNFSMMNFPFISSNIPAASTYGVYLSVDTPYKHA